jgi:hypothetical protein
LVEAVLASQRGDDAVLDLADGIGARRLEDEVVDGRLLYRLEGSPGRRRAASRRCKAVCSFFSMTPTIRNGASSARLADALQAIATPAITPALSRPDVVVRRAQDHVADETELGLIPWVCGTGPAANFHLHAIVLNSPLIAEVRDLAAAHSDVLFVTLTHVP